ncbi:hypothetical protein [Lysobacter humi (ex Lee et al. 2017)]
MSNAARLPTVLDEVLCTTLATGLVLVALLPSAREVTAIGWLPMWLVGMPAVAWWALRGFPLPARTVQAHATDDRPRAARRAGVQATRVARRVRRARLQQAA